MKNATDQQVYHRVAAAMQRLVLPADPYRTLRRKRLTYPEWEVVQDKRDLELMELKEARLHQLANCLVQASVRKTPKHIAERFLGDYGIDETLIKSGGKRGTDNHARQYVSSEPDGGRYFRDGNHGGKDGNDQGKRFKKDANSWGFEFHIVSMVKENKHAAANFLLLIAAVAWDRPAGRPGQKGVHPSPRSVKPASQCAMSSQIGRTTPVPPWRTFITE